MNVKSWWASRRVMAVTLLLTAMPLLWPTTPPLLDLPGHMASYWVSINLSNSSAMQRFFSFDWHVIGNLGVDLAIVPLGKLLGIELATKLICTAIPVMTAAAFLLIAKHVHGSVPPTAYAAIPLTYNYPFLFGFVNYSLSMAFALLAFLLWLKWNPERRTAVRALTFAVIAIAVWLSHAIGWVLMGALMAPAELYRQWLRRQRAGPALFWAVIACLPLLAPIPLQVLSPHEGGFGVWGFFGFDSTAKWTVSLLRDRWMWFDLLSFGFLAVLLLAAAFRLSSMTFAPRLGWGALALLLLFIVAPQSINDSYFVSARIACYAAAIGLIAISTATMPPLKEARLGLLCISFMVVRLSATTLSFFLYDQDYTRQLVALDHVPRGGSVVSFSGVPCTSNFGNWYNSRTYHLSGMAVVRREAFVNSTWSIPGLQLLRVHYPKAGNFVTDGSQMVAIDACPSGVHPPLNQALAAVPTAAFDHLWLIHIPQRLWPNDARLQRVWSYGDSVLFTIKQDTDDRR